MENSVSKIFYSSFGLFLLAMLILSVEYDVNVFGLMSLGAVVFIIFGAALKSINGGLAFILVMIGFIITIVLGIVMNAFLESETKKAGDRIIYALEQYYKRYEDLPDSLEELKPAFMDEIPLTKNSLSDVKFRYFKLSKRNFTLIFYGSANMKYEYSRLEGLWEYNE